MPPPEYVSREELALRLGLSKQRISQLVAEGIIPGEILVTHPGKAPPSVFQWAIVERWARRSGYRIDEIDRWAADRSRPT